MAITTENSVVMAKLEGIIQGEVEPHQKDGRIRYLNIDFTQGAAAGDIASFQRLNKLPYGRCRLILPLSYIAHSAFGAGATLDLGWEAYTDLDGVAVVADPNGLDAAVNVAAAGNFVPAGTLGGGETKLFNSQSGVVLVAQNGGAVIPVGATLKGFLSYVAD